MSKIAPMIRYTYMWHLSRRMWASNQIITVVDAAYKIIRAQYGTERHSGLFD